MKYKIKITVTDVYEAEMDVEADNLSQAYDKVYDEINACPVESRGSTVVDTETELMVVPEVHEVESLMGDEIDERKVVLVDDLDEAQKEYLGIKEV